VSRIARAVMLAATLLLGLGAAGADGIAPESRAEIQVEARRTKVYVGEVVELTLEIKYDGAWFDQHAAALFRQPMDVPVRALVPAFLPPEGLRAYVEPLAAWLRDGVPTFALGDQVVQSSSVGGTYSNAGALVGRSLSLSRRFHVTREGVIDLAPPSLEFAWAERFESDLLGVRAAIDPRRVTILGSGTQLTAFPLPAEGRPPEFHGWVGRYGLAMSAQADRTQLAAGEPLRLTVIIDGEGNHEELPIPTFDELRAFHVLGTLDERTPVGRTLRIDLAPLDATTREIPPLSLVFFDPQRGSYQESRSKPIPITVHGTSAPPVPVPSAPPEPATSRGWLLSLALGLLVLVGVSLWLWRRRARAVPASGPERQREALLTRLRGAAGAPEGGQALIDVLAWQLDAAPAAVVAPDLAVRLARSGLPGTLAERAAAAVEAGVAARYAGSHAVSDALPRELIADLAQALRRPRASPPSPPRPPGPR